MNFSKHITGLFLVSILLLLCSCGSTSSVKKKPFFNDQIVQKDVNEEIIVEQNIEDSRKVEGFRVRVAQAKDFEKIKEIERVITEKLGVAVYTEFIVDRYMIYAGDCKTREEATALKKKINDLGYTKRVFVTNKQVFSFNEITKKEQEYGYNSYSSFDNKPKIAGYRVQIFAGLNKDNALKIKRSAEKKFSYPVYTLIANDFYKVQMGDFKSRLEAEDAKEKISYTYDGSFIQKTTVFIDGNKSGYDNLSSSKNEPNDAIYETTPTTYKKKKTNNNTMFFMQVGAFSDTNKAKEFNQSIINSGFNNSNIEEENGLYKIVIGPYTTREAAELGKNKFLSHGFEEAWIIEK